MRRISCAIAVMGALGVAGPAMGQPHRAPLPNYEQGQVFVFDNGRVEEVRTVTAGGVVWAARSGRTYTRSANPVVPILEWTYRGQKGVRRVIGDANALWPLRAGARAQFRTINEARSESGGPVRRSVHMWTCTVGRAARVAVPAGAFDAHPIACDRFSPNSMRVLERVTWHYAPDIGHYIRRESRDLRDGQTERFSLFAALPPRQNNAVRIEALARAAVGHSGGE